MPRKPVTDISAWPALTLEGNLISPAMIANIDRREAPEQRETDYGLRKGISIREEISLAFRVGQAHYADFLKAGAASAAATTRFVRDFLRETLGFTDLKEGSGPVALTAGEGRVPVVVVPPADELDRRSAALSQDRPRSAALVLQDRLNAAEEALWGLATNGKILRLMRDNASLTRPAFIQADLAQIFETEDLASFALVWLLMHRTCFGRAGAPATDCALERWRAAGASAGEAARERLAGQVELALKELGSGFLEANRELHEKLAAHEIGLTEWFNELLRLVYRLIFLMVAEDRNLLHPPDAGAEERLLYAEGYSLAMLRALATRRSAWDRHHDRYEGLKIIFRALEGGEPRLGLPALGGLFAPGLLPTLEASRLPNRALLSAIYRLGWISDGAGVAPVNWQAMETEELGSVYESLLQLQPQLAEDGRRLVFASDAAEAKGNQRRTTGSYYTPDSLVQALLDTALDPVLDRAEAGAADPAEALLSLTVLDPACGSGHFLLAAARRIATRVARYRAGGAPSSEDFRHALRDVARRCIHGVDRNPMAVELTRVALWIETVDPGLPLGFFDAQIRCGDSLLGVFDLEALEQGIPDGAYKPLAGDDAETARHFAKRNRDEREGQGSLDFARGGGVLPAARQFATLGSRLRALPEDTPEQVAERARLFAALRAGPEWYATKVACDAYVAAFLAPKTGGVPANRNTVTIPTTAPVWEAMAGRMPYSPLVGWVVELAEAACAFHWPLEFPDVMAKGGFDVVLGNPPWEVLQLGEEEYFAARSPEIAALPGARRKAAIKALETTNPALWASYRRDLHEVEAINQFLRESGFFDLTARGKLNTYALFAELFLRLVGPGGRAGLIVPTGIATDDSTKAFFEAVAGGGRLASLYDFENREGLFPSVDSRMKFALLTLGSGEQAARFVFFATRPEHLKDARRAFTLSAEDIRLINPNTRTCPVFRSSADAELTKRIYARVPVLIHESRGKDGNPWGIEFRQGLFNMTSDSGLFRTAAQLAAAGFRREGADWVRPALAVGVRRGDELPVPGGGARAADRYVPLYEAKMIHHFDHRWATYAEDGDASREVTPAEKADPGFIATPRYWVPEAEVAARLAERGWTRRWLMGWRNVTNATNERTVIAAVMPVRGIGNSLPLFFAAAQLRPEHQASLVGSLSSLVCDFFARHKLGGTNLNFFIVRQLAVLPPSVYTPPVLSFLLPRLLELTYTAHDLRPWAEDLGFQGPPFAWNEDCRAQLRAELDAAYARLYGLTRNELRYILDPADIHGPDFPSETFRVLKEKEFRQFGDYRTARLVLAAWDRMEADGTFRAMDLA